MDFSVLSDACGASEFIVSEFLEGIRESESWGFEFVRTVPGSNY